MSESESEKRLRNFFEPTYTERLRKFVGDYYGFQYEDLFVESIQKIEQKDGSVRIHIILHNKTGEAS